MFGFRLGILSATIPPKGSGLVEGAPLKLNLEKAKMNRNEGKVKWLVRVGSPVLSHKYWEDEDPNQPQQNTPMWYGQSVSPTGTVSGTRKVFDTKQEAESCLEQAKRDEWDKYELSICKLNPRRTVP